MHKKIPKICTELAQPKFRPHSVEWQTDSSVQKQWFMPYLIDMSFVLPLKALSRKDDFFFILQKLLRRFEKVLHRMIWNPSIYNIIVRWFAGSLGQMTCRPSVWCSKHYFFIISYRLRALKTLYSYFCKFVKNQKINWTIFAKKFARHSKKNNT